MKSLHHRSMLVVLVACALMLASVADAAPKARLWDKWAAHDPASTARIDHRILRPIWRDPRIHYGVNCASIGCPNLQPRAFTASNADDLLDHAAREYVNHPRGVRFERCELHVSSIYDWFQEDFGGSARGVIEHLRQFARPQLERHLQMAQSIADDYYDWRLNDAQLPRDESADQGLDRMPC